MGFCIVNHPFWGTLICGNPHLNYRKLQNSNQIEGCHCDHCGPWRGPETDPLDRRNVSVLPPLCPCDGEVYQGDAGSCDLAFGRGHWGKSLGFSDFGAEILCSIITICNFFCAWNMDVALQDHNCSVENSLIFCSIAKFSFLYEIPGFMATKYLIWVCLKSLGFSSFP